MRTSIAIAALCGLICAASATQFYTMANHYRDYIFPATGTPKRKELLQDGWDYGRGVLEQNAPYATFDSERSKYANAQHGYPDSYGIVNQLHFVNQTVLKANQYGVALQYTFEQNLNNMWVSGNLTRIVEDMEDTDGANVRLLYTRTLTATTVLLEDYCCERRGPRRGRESSWKGMLSGIGNSISWNHHVTQVREGDTILLVVEGLTNNLDDYFSVDLTVQADCEEACDCFICVEAYTTQCPTNSPTPQPTPPDHNTEVCTEAFEICDVIITQCNTLQPHCQGGNTQSCINYNGCMDVYNNCTVMAFNCDLEVQEGCVSNQPTPSP